MSRKVVAKIVKQKYSPPGRDPYWVAELTLINEAGEEFVPSPIRFADFKAAADVLAREAKQTYEELQRAKVVYEAGKVPVTINLNLEDREIVNLGFRLPE